VHKFDFSDEEVMAYYISFLKTLSFRLNKHTIHFFYNEVSFFGGGRGSVVPSGSPPPWPSIFSDNAFLAHHPLNRDDRHLLAHAMASDFKVTWQLSKREKLFCVLLWVKLHTKHEVLFKPVKKRLKLKP
jgi:hypothetical protein